MISGERKAEQMVSELAAYRPVEFAPYLEKAGFTVRHVTDVSQNTFPSQVIFAVK